MIELNGGTLLLALACPAFVWLLLSYHEALIHFTLPTDRDSKELAKKPKAVQLAARHARALRIAAFALLTGTGWTVGAISPYASLAFGIAGVTAWMLAISWHISIRWGR